MTKKTVATAEMPNSGLGSQLRQRRRAKGLTLTELSRLAGLSVGLLSQIERGVSAPSLKSLMQISAALGIPPSWLFDQGSPQDPLEKGLVVRRGARRRLDLGSYGVTKELLTPDLGGELQLYLVEIRPGGQSGPEAYTHRGEEAGLVLAGTLELIVEDRTVLLYEGDSFRFESSVPHRYTNPGTTPTTAVWINSLPY
ncbi:MAG: cupin domain-containing protein [Burkholderiaceae bacterium]|nr:cupin domain-containing protein [Burkholderiaceae bacterium]